MTEIETKYSIDLTDFFAQMERASNKYADFDTQIKQSASRNPLASLAQKQGQFNQALGAQIQTYQRVQAVENFLYNERKRLETQLKDLKSRQLEFIAAGRYGELRTEIGKVQAKLKEMNSPLVETESIWERLKAKFKTGLKIPKVDVPPIPVPKTSIPTVGKGGNAQGGNALGGVIGDVAGELAGVAGVSLTAAGAVAAVGAVVVKSTKEWAEYGKALSELSGITGATGKALQFLDDQAQEVEADTGIAGVKVLEAFQAIGSIKPELLENNEVLAQTTKEVIALSQATPKLSLEEVARSLLGSLNQFGEAADQAARFSNVLVAGALKGSSEVNETAEALKNSGTAMKAAGISFEQGNGLIQILAKGMIKGAEAGTALRNVLLKLETQSDKNLRPSVVGLDEALENASKKFSTTTQLTKMFGVENIVAAKQILSARKEVTEMTKAITGTSTAYDQAKKNTDNLSTDLSKAGTAIDTFFRVLGQSQDGFLRKSIQSFTEFLNSLSSKTGVLRAFYRGLTEGSLIPIYATQRGFEEAARQSEANRVAEARKAEVDKISKAAVKSVTKETADKLKQYTEQGVAEPKALREAAAKVKEARDEEYKQAVADHKRLQAEAVAAGRYQTSAADSLKDKFSKQYEDSRKRILAAQVAKKQADSAVAQLAKADAERAAALKSALGEGPSDAKKKSEADAKKAIQDSNRLLLDAQKDYQNELSKLETQYGKDKLEALDKNSDEYIKRKAQLDRDEIEAERKHLEQIFRIQSAKTTRVNDKTGKREAVIDPTLKLPEKVTQLYTDRSAAVTAEEARKLEELRYQNSLKLLQITRQFDALEVEEVKHQVGRNH